MTTDPFQRDTLNMMGIDPDVHSIDDNGQITQDETTPPTLNKSFTSGNNVPAPINTKKENKNHGLAGALLSALTGIGKDVNSGGGTPTPTNSYPIGNPTD